MVSIVLVVADDEFFIRSAIKRGIIQQAKLLYHESNKIIKISIIEAEDGLETVTAMYLANKKNVKVDAIISDENMPIFSGSYSAKIIQEFVNLRRIKETKMFISTAITHSSMSDNCPKFVNKIYSKPLSGQSIMEILKSIK